MEALDYRGSCVEDGAIKQLAFPYFNKNITLLDGGNIEE